MGLHRKIVSGLSHQVTLPTSAAGCTSNFLGTLCEFSLRCSCRRMIIRLCPLLMKNSQTALKCATPEKVVFSVGRETILKFDLDF